MYKKVFIFLVIIRNIYSIYCAAPELVFDHVLELGSPSAQVFLQDDEGYLWFGTEGNGIFRYDGYNLKHYGPAPHLLSNGQIFSMIVDVDNPDVFWIGTMEGLNKFNKSNGSFTHYKNNPSDPSTISNNGIDVVIQDIRDSDTLWIGTIDGLNKFSKSSGTFTRYMYDPENENSIGYTEVWRIVQDRTEENHLWLALYGGGLDKFDMVTGEFTHYIHNPEDKNSIGDPDNSIYALHQDQDDPDIFWIGHTNGLDKYNKKTETFTHYNNNENDPYSIVPGPVILISENNTGELWLGSYLVDNGLTVFNKKNEEFYNYRSESNNPQSISNDAVTNVAKDRSGITWIMTYSGEIDKIDPHKSHFKTYKNYPGESNQLSNSAATVLYEDSNNSLWIGTQGGLNKIDRINNTIVSYINEPGNADTIENNYIIGILEDSDNNFWITSWLDNNLSKFDRYEGKVVERYPADAISLTKVIEDPDDSNILWVGAWGSGFAKFNKREGEYTYYTHNNINPELGPGNKLIYELHHDSKENVIWMGSVYGGGLSKFDKDSETFTHFLHSPEDKYSISANAIATIFEDHNGTLWIGTKGGGLNSFNRTTNTFMRFLGDLGIPSDVNSIVEDDFNNLWLGTNAGIIKFNPMTLTVEKQLTKADGMQGDNFAPDCALKSRDGTMFFGGVSGVNQVDIEELRINPTIPPVAFTTISQGGESLEILKDDAKEYYIVLDWSNNFFEFEYVALNYTTPEKNRYRYKLEGYDSEWYEAGTKRFGRYSNLPGGKTYTLTVQASNNDGIWNGKGKSLKIIVSRPFWKSPNFFYGVLFVVLLFIWIGIIIKFKTDRDYRIKLENEVFERTEELKHARDEAETANRAKTTFLSNISHELRTPLNGILGFTQLFLTDDSFSEDQMDGIKIIDQAGEHLLMLINDVLDMSKVEAGKLEMIDSEVEFLPFLSNIIEFFTNKAKDKNIDLQLITDDSIPSVIITDELRLRQVIFNLISNGIKFTSYGYCHLTVSGNKLDNGKYKLDFSVEDSGTGIDKTYQEEIFKPFHQVGNKQKYHEGTGLGLAISKNIIELMGGRLSVESPVIKNMKKGMGNGTCFSFSIEVNSLILAK